MLNFAICDYTICAKFCVFSTRKGQQECYTKQFFHIKLYLCSTDTDTIRTRTWKYVKSLKCRIRIYILYNYELYKLTIKSYAHKYVLN